MWSLPILNLFLAGSRASHENEWMVAWRSRANTSLSLFGTHMSERASKAKTCARMWHPMSLNHADCRWDRSRTRPAGLNSRKEKREGRFEKTKESREFISRHFEEELTDFTRCRSYDTNWKTKRDNEQSYRVKNSKTWSLWKYTLF